MSDSTLTREQFERSVSRLTLDEEFQAALQRYAHSNGSSRRIAAAAMRVMFGPPASGLSSERRLAIACGNEPYADERVCPQCEGRGHVWHFPRSIKP